MTSHSPDVHPGACLDSEARDPRRDLVRAVDRAGGPHEARVIAVAGGVPVPRTRRRRSAPQTIRPSVQRLLDRIDAPAYIRKGRMDILATNKLGEALYSEILANPRRPANTARFCFLDPHATTFFVDWDESADACVAVLRAEAGRNPHDQDLTNLIGELSTRSEDFRVRWARHDVGTHDAGVKRLHHPIVGRLELSYEGMALAADLDLVLFAFTAEAGSKSEEALDLLASWTATPYQRPAGDSSERTQDARVTREREPEAEGPHNRRSQP
jgi:transcription regulator MmyB-like protein